MLKHYQILIAEDETMILENIRHGLELLIPDGSFITAEDGAAAVAAAEKVSELHMAFLDIKMPLMTGLEAARHIQVRHKHCQIIFISAFSDFEFMQGALSLGAVNYLLKPFTQTDLAKTVQKALLQIEKYQSIKNSAAQIQSQTKRYSRWADSQFLLNIVSGQQSPESIHEHLEQMGIHFQNGLFAIVRCPKGVHAKKIGGLLRGSDWGKAMKLFLYEQKSYIFILSITSLPQPIAFPFSERLLIFCQEVRESLHCVLDYAVGEEFTQLSATAKSCFNCHYQLLQRLPFQIFPYQTSESGDLPACTQEYLAQMLSFLTCAGLLGMQLDRVIYQFLLSVSPVALNLGVPGKKVQPLRRKAEQMLRVCTDFEQLENACRMLVKEIDQAATLRMMQRMNRDETRDIIVSYVEEHYGEDITLESAAVSMHYSAAYFSKLFKRLFEQTFTSYLTSVRMEHAKIYLSDSTASIREISGYVGFHDSAYFTSAFRRLVGCTPTEYRMHSIAQTVQESGEDQT